MRVKLPKLSIDLLFHHLILNVAPLVNQLLLALNRRAIVVKLLVFFAQSIIFLLELHVLPPRDFVRSFLLAFRFELLQALEHLLSHLLRSLHRVMEFLLVNAILRCEQLGQPLLPQFEVGRLALPHIVDAVADDVLFD